MDLTISMLALNGIELTVDCLESIPGATGELNVETVFVDNGSTDGTSKVVSERFPWVKLIQNEMNCGFSIAVNQGVEQATGRYILVLNNDTRLLPGSLEKIVEFLDTHLDVGIVTPQLTYEDGRLQNSIANLPTLTEIFVGKWILQTLFPNRYPGKHSQFQEPTEVESVVGAAMIIRREVVEKIGALDERFFIFLEETDWCLRTRRAGWKIFLLPEARLIHHQGQTVNRAHTRKCIEYNRSLFRYFRRHHPAKSVFLRVLFPIKNLFEIFFSSLAVILTCGLAKRARRRLVEKSATFWWQVRGCPEGNGLRPPNLRVPPGRESLIPREAVS